MESDTEKVDISDPSSLFHLIEPQWPTTTERPKHKFWHFKFAADETESQFTAALEKLGDSITVKYNYVGKDKPDVLLTDNDEFIGKIQFIHFDKRDRKTKAKHYIKLYFIQFEPAIFEKAKKIVVQFFDERRKGSSKDVNNAVEAPKNKKEYVDSRTRILSHITRKKKQNDNKKNSIKNSIKNSKNIEKIQELQKRLEMLYTRKEELKNSMITTV